MHPNEPAHCHQTQKLCKNCMESFSRKTQKAMHKVLNAFKPINPQKRHQVPMKPGLSQFLT